MSVICCPLSGGDGDGPSCSTISTRKARKEHRCCECSETILPGQQYEHISGIWDGHPSDHKTCLSCAEIRDHFACEDGFEIGTLWEQLEENFLPDMRAGGPCMEGLSAEAKLRLFAARLAWLETDDGRDYLKQHVAKPPERERT